MKPADPDSAPRTLLAAGKGGETVWRVALTEEGAVEVYQAGEVNTTGAIQQRSILVSEVTLVYTVLPFS